MSKRYIGIHIVYMRMSENIVANIFKGIILYTLWYQTTFFLFGYVNLWIFPERQHHYQLQWFRTCLSLPTVYFPIYLTLLNYFNIKIIWLNQ